MERLRNEPLEWSHTAFLCNKAFRVRQKERPFTSKLSPLDREKLTSFPVRPIIRTFTYRCAHLFWKTLEERSWKLVFSYSDEERCAIVSLHFYTYIGGNTVFWDKLFALLAPQLRSLIPHIHDEEIWNAIIPLGYETLRELERLYPRSWAGKITFPIPALFSENVIIPVPCMICGDPWTKKELRNSYLMDASRGPQRVFDSPRWKQYEAPVIPPQKVITIQEEKLLPVYWNNALMHYLTRSHHGKVTTHLLPGSLQPIDGWLQPCL